MSTYKLWELANREGVNGLLPYVEDAVLSFKESEINSLTKRVPTEVGEPMARYVHGKIMAAARVLKTSDPQPPRPVYTHIALPKRAEFHDTYGEVGMARIVRDMTGGVLSDEEVRQLALSIGYHLRYYGLAESMKGSGVAGYWTRPWPKDLVWRHHAVDTLRKDFRAEKRITEEADKPVKVYRSAKVVVGDVPDKITPEWAVETIKRMAKAFDDLAERHVKLEEKYVELEARYEEMVTDPWEEATTNIKAVLS